MSMPIPRSDLVELAGLAYDAAMDSDPSELGALPPANGDTPLVERLRRGDEAAFASLVEQFGPRMLAATRRILVQEEEAQDAVQEAFFQAFRALGQFSGQSSLGTWIHRIAINAALMRLRSKKRRPESSIEDLLPKFDGGGHQIDAQTWADPESVCSAEEMKRIVRRGIEELPESFRTVLVLRDIEELDTEETAQLIGISSNAVKVRLHRARQALKTLIEPYLLEKRG